jgi:AcrR family transcriptional regulator
MEGKKTDRRIRYTQMVIKQSLIELMKSRPINKITVTDICELADINRGTFYTHFSDPYALLSQIENELFGEINRTIEKSLDSGKVYELLLEIFKSIAAKADLCKVLFSEFGDKDFLKRILYIAHDRSIAEWKTVRKDLDDDTVELLYSFVANGSVGIIHDWIQDGMKQSMREIADFINRISYSGLQHFLGRP